MEIERKFLVKELPNNLEQYPHHVMEQCYLCAHPVVRVRKKDDKYIFTFKSRNIPEASEEKICVSNEMESEITKEAYEHLKKKADGIVIEKTRYKIPYEKYTIELDVFCGEYDGMILAEVEFPSIEEAKEFTPPEWFGDDVSDDFRYRNNYLATKEK